MNIPLMHATYIDLTRSHATIVCSPRAPTYLQNLVDGCLLKSPITLEKFGKLHHAYRKQVHVINYGKCIFWTISQLHWLAIVLTSLGLL